MEDIQSRFDESLRIRNEIALNRRIFQDALKTMGGDNEGLEYQIEKYKSELENEKCMDAINIGAIIEYIICN